MVTPIALIAIAVSSIVFWIAFKRIIIRVLTYGALALGVGLAGLAAIRVDDRLARAEFLTSAIVGGVTGFLVVGILCAAWIRHGLIYFYLQRTIQRDRDAAKAGKLW